MKPLTYYQQIVRMKGKADKFDLRLRMVKHALAYGVKPTARVFDTTPKTVRKWLRRYQQERLAGLNELPRIPLTCPHKTPPAMEPRTRFGVRLRKDYPFMGAKRLKRQHNLPCSHEAIRRILHEHGLIKKRRKKSRCTSGEALRPVHRRYKGFKRSRRISGLASDEDIEVAQIPVHGSRNPKRPDVLGLQ